MHKAVRISSDLKQHLAWLHEDAAIGYFYTNCTACGRSLRAPVQQLGIHINGRHCSELDVAPDPVGEEANRAAGF